MAYATIWKMTLIGLGPKGEAIVNTFHVGITGAEDPATTALELLLPWQGIIEAQFPQLVTPDWHEYECQALCIKGVNKGKSASVAATVPTFGTLAGPSAPLTVAAIGTRLSDGIGRHSRGRCFICPINAADVDVDGRFTLPGGWLLAWSGCATVGPAVGPVTYDCVLYNATADDASLVIQASAADLVGVQRRRRLRLPN